ncbi:MAG: hypothetical protein B6241_13965 [Spirochaetaceae bacterium 4572_59]|nr:MAG: hypothetical protein B6241_13965 [Spirochaetaceae bacterium 4572_59]
MYEDNWKKLLSQSCTTVSELSEYITLNREEQEWFDTVETGLSLLVNPYFAELAGTSEAIRRQCVPRAAELLRTEVESDDPLAEDANSPLPRMVHRYKNRVAVLVTDHCAMHCRHCFRRSFTGQGRKPLSRQERDEICFYLKEHTEVKEVLLTGGDLLTLSDGPLLELLKAFRDVREDLLLRLATRIPSSLPQRITPYLVQELGKLGPVWVITQFNHPHELTRESRGALNLLRKGGLPVMNQTVLLKGINDREDVLAELFQSLLVQGVKPYYLFQGDLAAGTSHFRTNLERGWEIMKNLRREISGLAMPVYAVDLPGGGGKIPLSESYLVEKKEAGFCFQNPEGHSFIYPDE